MPRFRISSPDIAAPRSNQAEPVQPRAQLATSFYASAPQRTNIMELPLTPAIFEIKMVGAVNRVLLQRLGISHPYLATYIDRAKLNWPANPAAGIVITQPLP